MKRGESTPRLTPQLFVQLTNQGYSQVQIAHICDVSKARVNQVKLLALEQVPGFKDTPRNELKSNFPWKIPEEMQRAYPHRLLRDHGEFMVTGGKGMTDNALMRLRGWYRKLKNENVVLEFNPEFPPVSGIRSGGWRYVERDEKIDGDPVSGSVIRVNDLASLTEDSRSIWTFPPELP